MGFHFARGSCNLSFGSDILVIMFMGFVLVDLFGEWLWIWYNDSHLRFTLENAMYMWWKKLIKC